MESEHGSVTEPDEQRDLPFDVKYMRCETSGLEFQVKAVPNEYPIRLDRARKNRR